MATKPSVHAEWDTNGTNISPTTAGHKANGYATNEIPTSAEFNDWMKQVSDWTKWLLDAELNDVTLANVVVTGGTTYTGITSYALTANQDNWDPLGTGNIVGTHLLAVTPDAAGYQVSGLVGGVNGRLVTIVNKSATDHFKLLSDWVGSTAANRFSFPAHMVTENVSIRVQPGGSVTFRYDGTASRWVPVHMVGCMRKSVIRCGAHKVSILTGSNAIENPSRVRFNDTNFTYWPFDISDPGVIIAGFVVYVQKTSSVAATVRAQLNKQTGDGTSSGVGSESNNATEAPGYIKLAQFDTLNEVVANGWDGVDGMAASYHMLVWSSPVTAGNDSALIADLCIWKPI